MKYEIFAYTKLAGGRSADQKTPGFELLYLPGSISFKLIPLFAPYYAYDY